MKKLSLTLILALIGTLSFAQIFRIDSLPKHGVLLDKGWKWYEGDNLDFAKANFDDSSWDTIDPSKFILDLPQVFNTKVKWLRLKIEIKKTFTGPTGISVSQIGASEIYLNGRLIHTFGHFDTDSSKVIGFDPLEDPVVLPTDSIGYYTLAVRYALQPDARYTRIFGIVKNDFFKTTLVQLIPALKAKANFKLFFFYVEVFSIGVLFMLFLLHSTYFLFYRRNKTNLFLTIYFISILMVRCLKLFGENQNSIEYRYYIMNASNWCLGFGIVWLGFVFYRIAKIKLDWQYYIALLLGIAYVAVSTFSFSKFHTQTFILMILSFWGFLIIVRLVRVGIKKKLKGYPILGIAIIIAASNLALRAFAVLKLNYGLTHDGFNELNFGISPYILTIIFHIDEVAIPFGLSLFMGIEIRETNKSLSNQLKENERLKMKAIDHEHEKQKMLEAQNDILELQVEERTLELKHTIDNLKSAQAQLVQKEKLASLGELTAGIAHEIQNPLNFVNNFSEMSVELLEELKSPLTPDGGIREGEKVDMELFDDVVQNLGKINLHGKRASSIVSGMLEHSRTSTGEQMMTDINKLADEYLRLSYHGIRAKNSNFNADYELIADKNLPLINIVPQDIGRVLLNLINNAFYACTERSRSAKASAGTPAATLSHPSGYSPKVTVSTRFLSETADVIVEGRMVAEIQVKDNGAGMSSDVQAKIFQPFFTTKPTGEGTGLGLSLAYDIITKGHGGTIEVESMEGQGSTFIVKLPLQV